MAIRGTQQGQRWFVILLTIASAFIVFQMAKKNRVQSDWSHDQLFQLSPELETLLEKIDQKKQSIVITAFTAQEGRKDSVYRNQRVRDILSQIQKRSNSISFRIVDYDAERTTAVQLGVKSYGTIVVMNDSQRIDIPERKIFYKQYGDSNFQFNGEAVLLDALRSVCFSSDKNMSVLTGHGERSLFSSEGSGFTGLNSLFRNQGYEIKNLNLLNEPVLSKDLDILVIPEPQTPLTNLEQQSIIEFIERGGDLWVANLNSVPLVATYLEVLVQPGIVAGPKAQFPYWDRPIVEINPTSEMGWMAKEQFSIVFMRGGAFQLNSTSTTLQQTSWVRLPKGSWLERGEESNEGLPTFDSEVDWKGDASLLAGIQIDTPSGLSRVVVMQDFDWLQNATLESIPANAVLANQVLEWLSDSEPMVRQGRDFAEPLLITKPQFSTIRWAVMLPNPLLIAVFGFKKKKKRDESL